VILNHEFTVDGDLETVWRTLLDLPRVAGCLPGATIAKADDEGAYEGTMKVRIGPMAVTYNGTASFVDVNDEEHRAVISLRAREAKGQGTALATITNHVAAEDGAVRVRAETDLQITGPQARFGRGILEEVGNRVLGEFAQRLQRELSAEAAGAALPPVDDAFDVGGAIAETGAAKTARRLAPLIVGAIVFLILWRRRSGASSDT
jgi:carbon monoxide dehydrogenase subunit G